MCTRHTHTKHSSMHSVLYSVCCLRGFVSVSMHSVVYGISTLALEEFHAVNRTLNVHTNTQTHTHAHARQCAHRAFKWWRTNTQHRAHTHMHTHTLAQRTQERISNRMYIDFIAMGHIIRVCACVYDVYVCASARKQHMKHKTCNIRMLCVLVYIILALRRKTG